MSTDNGEKSGLINSTGSINSAVVSQRISTTINTIGLIPTGFLSLFILVAAVFGVVTHINTSLSGVISGPVSTKMAADTTALAKTYFAAWNDHDTVKLSETFSDSVVLRDWDISAEGKQKVTEANGNIFKAVPAISLEVVNIFVGSNPKTGNTPVATCEILVHVAKEKGKIDETLKVTDIIEFDNAGKITAVRAYKG